MGPASTTAHPHTTVGARLGRGAGPTSRVRSLLRPGLPPSPAGAHAAEGIPSHETCFGIPGPWWPGSRRPVPALPAPRPPCLSLKPTVRSGVSAAPPAGVPSPVREPATPRVVAGCPLAPQAPGECPSVWPPLPSQQTLLQPLLHTGGPECLPHDLLRGPLTTWPAGKPWGWCQIRRTPDAGTCYSCSLERRRRPSHPPLHQQMNPPLDPRPRSVMSKYRLHFSDYAHKTKRLFIGLLCCIWGKTPKSVMSVRTRCFSPTPAPNGRSWPCPPRGRKGGRQARGSPPCSGGSPSPSDFQGEEGGDAEQGSRCGIRRPACRPAPAPRDEEFINASPPPHCFLVIIHTSDACF